MISCGGCRRAEPRLCPDSSRRTRRPRRSSCQVYNSPACLASKRRLVCNDCISLVYRSSNQWTKAAVQFLPLGLGTWSWMERAKGIARKLCRPGCPHHSGAVGRTCLPKVLNEFFPGPGSLPPPSRFLHDPFPPPLLLHHDPEELRRLARHGSQHGGAQLAEES